MAAVLACGEGAALSHRSAAALWKMLPPASGPSHVSTSARSGRARQVGIRLHRCGSLTPDLIAASDGIPVTTPARTVADLRGSVPVWELRRAVRQAGFLGLDLGPETGSDGTRSELERDFLRLCRRQRLPRPEVNVRVGGWTVDFLWRRERLVVETDGYGAHRGRAAFEADHGRDLDLRRRGLEVRRFTYRQVHDAPATVAADLRDALALSS
jgi:very-short-patch-repair endonuclease